MLTGKVVSYSVEGEEDAGGEKAARCPAEMWYQQLTANQE